MSIARQALMRCYAHLETARPYTIGYVGLVGLAGAALTGTDATGQAWFVAWAAPTLGWLAALYGGDYFDRRLDAVSKPHRPIPSGRMHPLEALAGMLLCATLGAFLASSTNERTLGLVVAALLLGVSYSCLFKARGLMGNLVRGSITALAFLFGTMTVSDLPRASLLPIALLFWIHDAGTNLVGTIRDVDGDRAGGYRTLAVARGVPAAIRFAFAAYLVWLCLALTVPWLVESGRSTSLYWAMLCPAAIAWIAALHPLSSKVPVEPRAALRAHEWLVLERIVLAGALLVYGAGPAYATPALLILLATAISQVRLRGQYEFAGRPTMAPDALSAPARVSP
jgi:4-hydroxybenzoate polyprenyltransferase and related prenyltransferases